LPLPDDSDRALPDDLARAVRFDEHGLVPAIVQQRDTGEVLMFAWMDAEALDLTLRTGETHFWSRSRQELWHKGATSGNTQPVVDVRVDCDADVLLVTVDIAPTDVACHTGERSCFHRRLADLAGDVPTPDTEETSA
jgi:phosphoribosyl-AMP cyclohydrolase